MKLHASIANAAFDIEFRRQQDRVSAIVDGRSYEVDVRIGGSASYLILHDGGVFDCRIASPPKSGTPVDVYVGTDCYAVTLTDPKRLRGATDLAANAGGAARIVAPMPGKVVRVLVKTGASVEAGDGVVVVEAMKMQNEMKSPQTGTVTALNVEVGATVNGGDVLAIVE